MKLIMGNCLDIPPPPPKGRSVYMTRPRYFVVRRRFPVSAADMAREYPAYQPYAFFGGFRPPMVPHTTPDPFYTYGLEPPPATPAYYEDSDYFTYSSQDYDEQRTSSVTRARKHRRAREKRSRHADSFDRGSQRLSIDVTGTQNGVVSTANQINMETTSIPESATTVALVSPQIGREVLEEHHTGILWQAASIKSDGTQNNSEVSPMRTTSSMSDSEIEEIIIDDSPVVTAAIIKVQPGKGAPGDDEVDDFLHSEPPDDKQVDTFLLSELPDDKEFGVSPHSESTGEDIVDAFLHSELPDDKQVDAFIHSENLDDDRVDAFIHSESLDDDQVDAFLHSENLDNNEVDAILYNQNLDNDQVDAFRQSHTTLEISSEQPRQYDTRRLLFRDDPSVLVKSSEVAHPIHSTNSPCDVVICHHSADRNIMLKIKSKLENSRVSVAVSYPTGDSGFVDWLMFPQAVVDAKIMVVLLSQNSVRDQQTADDVCLAHATDTIVYPVTLDRSLDLDTVMDACLKLQLSCYKWIQLADGDNPDFAIALMTRSVKEDLVSLERTDVIAQCGVNHRAHVRYRISRHRQSQQKKVKFGGHVTATQYWVKHFGSETNSVPWNKFYEDLHKDYRNQWNDIIPQTAVFSLRECLKQEIASETDDTVHKARFLEFCNNLDIDQDVWERVHSFAIEIQSVTRVLDEKSSVRMVAIENIAKFDSQKAINALRALVTDSDPNIRAVAVMSLSRSIMEEDETSLKMLLATLDDKNGLVRETGCLALGHLRATAALVKLRSLCLNDTNSPVRDAAAVALNKIERN